VGSEKASARWSTIHQAVARRLSLPAIWNIVRTMRLLPLVLAFAVGMASSVARAQEAMPAHVVGTTPPGSLAAPIAITGEQLAAFSELVGEPRPVVWQRLQADPLLTLYAVAAADARLSRKASGKTRTIIGFSILGTGIAAGYIIMLASLTDLHCSSDSCDNDVGSGVFAGFIVMAASAGIGLGLGIPGIVSMARQSQVETAAVERYQYPQIRMPPAYGLGAPGGRVIRVPLLSLSF
jgi:hypothetical protein